MTMSAAGSVGLVKATASALGVPLPAGFVTAIDKANALVAAAESIGAGPQELHRVVLDALQNGRDLHADKAVGKAVLHHTLANVGVGQAARQVADHSISEALVTYADDMLGSWQQVLAPHLVALTEAATELPEDLDDTRTISAMGASAMASWAAATECIRLTEAATKGVMAISTAAHVAITRDRRALLITTADPDALDAIVRTTGAHPNTWTLARAGQPLRLVGSLGELLERLASYDEQRQAAIDAERRRQEHPRKVAHA